MPIDPRNKMLFSRVTAKEKRRAEDAAKRADLKLSEWVRETVLQRLAKEEK